MTDSLLDTLFRMCLPLLFEAASIFLLGLAAIPLLRAKKTGRYDRHLGRRFASDGSEPSLGGLVMGCAFIIWYIPNALTADLTFSAVRQDSRSALVFAGVYALMIMLLGAYEDYRRQFLGMPLALKPSVRFGCELLLSLMLLISVNFGGQAETAVLLPFRLGYMELGILYYPLTAILMTLVIRAFDLHFCAESDQRKHIGGLSEITGALSLLTLTLCCETAYSHGGALISCYGAACCIGMLVWTFPPSKLITGQSGAAFTGALFVSAAVLSKLELLLFLAAVPQLVSAVSVPALHMKNKKKRIVNVTDERRRSRSLACLLRDKGFSDLAVIVVFVMMSLTGAVISEMLALYAHSTRI